MRNKFFYGAKLTRYCLLFSLSLGSADSGLAQSGLDPSAVISSVD